MKAKLLIFLAGAAGGISPNIMSLGIALTRDKASMPEVTYFAGIMIFAFMGATVAWIWNETDLKKAFYIGVGLPSIIQLSVDNMTSTSEARSESEQAHSFLSLFIPEAVAQEPEKQVANRKLNIITKGKTPGFEIEFLSVDGKCQSKVMIDQQAARSSVNVPDYANRFAVKIGASTSAYESLTSNPGDTTVVSVAVAEKAWSGFKQALGVKAVEQYQIDVKRVK